MSNFSLLGKGGEKNDCLFPLPERAIGMGTDPDNCSIIFSQGKDIISPFHCQLVPTQNGWQITDFSDKGTWLNGKKMTPFQAYPLKDGDVFYIASLENSFYFSVVSNKESPQNQGQAQNFNQGLPQNQGQAQNFGQWSPQNQNQFKNFNAGIATTQSQEFNIIKNLLTYKGRLDRKTYIIQAFYLTVINALIWLLLGIILTLWRSTEPEVIIVLVLLAILAVLIPGVMLGIRRLHDLDKPGWYILAGIVPIVNFYILYLLYVKDGTQGPNRFGNEYHYQAPFNSTQRNFEEKFLTFEGRLNRKPYILRQLGLWGATIGIAFVAAFILALFDALEADIQLVVQIVITPCLYPFPLLTIRRLHDLDKSGWLYLIMIVPLINIIFCIYLLFFKGTVGQNLYGADPLI